MILTALLLLTAVSVMIDHMFTPGFLARATVVSLALVKMRFVAFEYMELRHAPVLLRRGFDAWTIILWIILIIILAG